MTENDTITYNDTLYYRCLIQDCSSVYIGDLFVREDTSMGHIYRYYPNLQQEVLWCDMSLNVGDTFHLPEIDGNPWYEYYYNEENTDLIVDSIIYMNGRKIICFQSADFSYSRFSIILPIFLTTISVYDLLKELVLLTDLLDLSIFRNRH